MSYEPTNWQTGDIITAEKLNKLENGVAGSASDAFEVNFTLAQDWESETESYIATCDKTYAEIDAAYNENKKIYAWLRYVDVDFSVSEEDNHFLARGYSKMDDDDVYFVFYFVADTNEFTIARTNFVLGSETLTADFTVEANPVYIKNTYFSGRVFDETTYELFSKAIGAGVPVYIEIGANIGGGETGYGMFIFDSDYPTSPGWCGGYCFAGSPALIGSTARINYASGEFDVTLPNS